MTNKIRKSRILAEVHETATGLHRTGVISKRRMHEYEALSHLAVPDIGASKIPTHRRTGAPGRAAGHPGRHSVRPLRG